MSSGFERNIEITISWEGEIYPIKTYVNEYRSLMMLIYDKIGPEEFGECLGMGKCGTCLIEIIESKNVVSSFGRNEETTMAKIGTTNKAVRLSCQILIDENLNGLKLNIIG